MLYTPVDITPCAFALDTSSRVMLMGSCFAEHVGEHLMHELNEGMVEVNPFGVLYNPQSIAQALRLLMAENGEREVTERVFMGQDGVWHSWLHTTYFSGKTREECEEKIVTRYRTARELLKSCSLLCITFGTTRCYRLDDGFIVANCHKESQKLFSEYELTISELSSLYKDLLEELSRFNPDMKVCFTVSPYRYRKYGFHGSQIQKAKLLLLTNEMAETGALYFPAYELMMDELRDYRFYADDMLHPSSLAVSIIYDRFKAWCFSEDLKNEATANLKAWKRNQHRQINR